MPVGAAPPSIGAAPPPIVLSVPERQIAARVPPPEPDRPVPSGRRAIFFDVENSSRADHVDRVLTHLAVDRASRRTELIAVGNWKVIGQDTARLLARKGAALVHSAPSTGVRDWSDLRIAIAAGVWLASARPGDVIEIISDDRAFDAVGEEALSPAVDQRGFAAFLYEEVTWPHVTFQFGARVDDATYEPNGEPVRDFTTGSGSLGLLLRPGAADDRITVAVSLAYASRVPALEELFYFGPHPGNFAFEVGNPSLDPEKALGFDVALRWRAPRASGEVTYFRNDISDFVFRAPLTEEEFAARIDEFAARFPGRGIEDEIPSTEGFPIIENVAADSILQGLEAHSDLYVTTDLIVELGLDYVRGTLKATDQPLPRMPPLRFRTGLRYQRNAFQAGGDVTISATRSPLCVSVAA